MGLSPLSISPETSTQNSAHQTLGLLLQACTLLTDGKLFGQNLVKILGCKLRSSSATVTIEDGEVRNTATVGRTGKVRKTLAVHWTVGQPLASYRGGGRASRQPLMSDSST